MKVNMFIDDSSLYIYVDGHYYLYHLREHYKIKFMGPNFNLAIPDIFLNNKLLYSESYRLEIEERMSFKC